MEAEKKNHRWLENQNSKTRMKILPIFYKNFTTKILRFVPELRSNFRALIIAKQQNNIIRDVKQTDQKNPIFVIIETKLSNLSLLSNSIVFFLNVNNTNASF